MSNQPEKEFRAGPIKATIWSNTKSGPNGQSVNVYSVSIQKSYQDENGTLKNSTTFFPDDLPKLNLVIQKSYEYINLK